MKAPYRVYGASSQDSPGYVLGDYETEAAAHRAASQFSRWHGSVWVAALEANGEYRNDYAGGEWRK